jgi:hypothetical protein
MKYVKVERDGSVSWDDYFDYIEKIKAKLPVDVYEFASRWEHYSISDRSSLHDSWLKKIEVFGGSPASEDAGINLCLVFLGPYHDRIFKMIYKNVSGYEVAYSESERRADLYIHEVSLSGEGAVQHEILFDGGGFIKIICESFIFEQELGSMAG